MHYRYPDHYVVEREKIREYADAVQERRPGVFRGEGRRRAGYDGLPAPLTFISVFGYKAVAAFFEHANIAIDDEQIVQVDQVLEVFCADHGGRLACTATCPLNRYGAPTAPTSS